MSQIDIKEIAYRFVFVAACILIGLLLREII